MDLSSNPYDLRPAVNAITERVSQSLRNPNQKIALVLGEYHSIPSTKMLQPCILQEVQKFHDFVFSFELPHDTLRKEIKAYQNIIQVNLEKKEIAHDRNGHRSLMLLQTGSIMYESPVTLHSVMDFCRAQHIKTCFADVALTKGAYILDRDDPDTAHLIANNTSRFSNESINARDKVGMALRNIFLAGKTREYADSCHANLMIIQTGQSHVFGSKSLHCAYQESLTTELKKLGVHPIPVIFDCASRNSIRDVPVDSKDSFADAIVIRGCLEDVHVAPKYSLEAGHIKKIAQKSQLIGFKPFVAAHDNALNLTNNCIELRNEVISSIPLWFAEDYELKNQSAPLPTPNLSYV